MSSLLVRRGRIGVPLRVGRAAFAPSANETGAVFAAFPAGSALNGETGHGDGDEAQRQGGIVEVDDASGTEGEGESRVRDVLAVVEGGGERCQVEEEVGEGGVAGGGGVEEGRLLGGAGRWAEVGRGSQEEKGCREKEETGGGRKSLGHDAETVSDGQGTIRLCCGRCDVVRMDRPRGNSVAIERQVHRTDSEATEG